MMETAWKYKPYPEYEDSGVEWFGKIPTHWKIKKLKYTLENRHGAIKVGPFGSQLKLTDMNSDAYKVYNQKNVITNNFGEGEDYISATKFDELQSFQIYPDDILITTRGTIGRCVITPKDIKPGVLHPCLMRIQINKSKLNNNFFIALIQDSPLVFNQLKLLSNATTLDVIYSESMKNIFLPMPPLNEQDDILSFLDRETARINELIAKKEQLIALLEEKRTALISHAVTKGLNPDAKMKDSGIEWLGEVPEHWSVAPVYSRYEVQLGKMLDQKRVIGESLAPYLRNVDVQWDKINTSDLPQMDFTSYDRKKYSLITGDLLVCEGGEVGRAAIWKEELEPCFYQKALHRLRPFKDVDLPSFFYYCLYTAAKQNLFIVTGNQNTIDHLTAEKLKIHRFAFPPLDEQSKIVKYIDNKCDDIDTLTNKNKQVIEKLQEYRTALISASRDG